MSYPTNEPESYPTGDTVAPPDRDRFTFRRLTRADFVLLARWLAEPHVRRWWNHDFTPEAVERDFGCAVDGCEPSEDHLVLLHGRPFGLIQCCRFGDYPEYLEEMDPVFGVSPDAVSIDYFIGDVDQCGRGMGRAMLATFVAGIWSRYPGAPNVVVPVNAANAASWKALSHAGFVEMARVPLTPDNPVDGPLHVIMQFDRPRPVQSRRPG